MSIPSIIGRYSDVDIHVAHHSIVYTCGVAQLVLRRLNQFIRNLGKVCNELRFGSSIVCICGTICATMRSNVPFQT